MARRRVLVTIVAATAVLFGAPAWAYFTASDSSSVSATATSLVQVATVSASPTDSTDAHVSWAESSSPNPSTVKYTVKAGSTTYCSAVTGTSCDPSGLSPLTSYTFSVTPVLQDWQGPAKSAAPIMTPANATASKLAITSSAVSGAASVSASLGPITVQLQTLTGTAVTATSPVVVNLSSDSTGAIIFATALNGTTNTSSVTIPNGSNSVSFYYGDTKAGTPTITTSSNALAAATQIETITAGVASKLSFISAAVSGSASSSAALGPIRVQVQDSNGNPVSVSSSVTVTLTSNSTGAAKFAATSGGTGVASVSISTGSSSVSFYYGDTKAGSPTITAATSALTATQIESISGANNYSSLLFVDCTKNRVPTSCDNLTGVGNGGTVTGEIEALDQFGNIATPNATITVSLASGNKWPLSSDTVSITSSANPSAPWSITNTLTGNGGGNGSTTITAKDNATGIAAQPITASK